MRNKLIVIFFFIILLSTGLSAHAVYDYSYPGSLINPLQVQIVPQTGDKLDALIRQQSQDRMLYQLQELQRQQMDQKVQSYLYPQRTTTPSGILCNGKYWSSCPTGENFVCPSSGDARCEKPKTSNQICQGWFGVNSAWSGKLSESGGPLCDCLEGFTPRETSDIKYNEYECVSNNQICQSSYGINSNWSGAKNDQGGLVCGCVAGYQWNTGSTKCVLAPKKEIPAVNPIVKKEAEEVAEQVATSTQDVAKESLVAGVGVISDQVSLDNKEAKPKSLWARIKGWFGF